MKIQNKIYKISSDFKLEKKKSKPQGKMHKNKTCF